MMYKFSRASGSMWNYLLTESEFFHIKSLQVLFICPVTDFEAQRLNIILPGVSTKHIIIAVNFFPDMSTKA